MIKKLSLDDVSLDGGTQPRACLDLQTVSDYAEAWSAGAEFPPIIVFCDGSKNWLADGFHRYHGATKAGVKTIPAEVRKGTVRDAILYAVGANTSHGLRRTNADKRYAVTLLLKDAEWQEWSDRVIAEKCGVSHTFVASARAQLATVASCHNRQDTKSPTKTKGRDGKRRKRKRRDNTKSVPRPAPIDDEVPDDPPPKPAKQVDVIGRIKASIEAHVTAEMEGQPPHVCSVIADWLETLAANLRSSR